MVMGHSCPKVGLKSKTLAADSRIDGVHLSGKAESFKEIFLFKEDMMDGIINTNLKLEDLVGLLVLIAAYVASAKAAYRVVPQNLGKVKAAKSLRFLVGLGPFVAFMLVTKRFASFAESGHEVVTGILGKQIFTNVVIAPNFLVAFAMLIITLGVYFLILKNAENLWDLLVLTIVFLFLGSLVWSILGFALGKGAEGISELMQSAPWRTVFEQVNKM